MQINRVEAARMLLESGRTRDGHFLFRSEPSIDAMLDRGLHATESADIHGSLGLMVGKDKDLIGQRGNHRSTRGDDDSFSVSFHARKHDHASHRQRDVARMENRDQHSMHHAGGFVYLSYVFNRTAYHVLVQQRSGLFFIGLRAFSSLADAVAYFRAAPVDPGWWFVLFYISCSILQYLH